MADPRKVQRHCMFVSYVKNQEAKTEDALVVKERLRDPETGKEKPYLRIVENYKRPIYITKKGVRAEHKQKREYEYLENLDEYRVTDAEMPFRINSVLGRPEGDYPRLRKLCRSPYVYGTDITSAVLLKHDLDEANSKRNGNWAPDYTVAVADYETNMHSDEQEIITGAISYKNHGLIVATKSFMSGIEDPEHKMKEVTERYLDKEILDRKMKVTYLVVDNDFHVCKELFRFAHLHKPDFLTFWNMSFDIGKTLESCERHNVNPANLFSDPSIPKKYRFFNYVEDRPNQTSASGRHVNKDPSEQWHKIYSPASFYVIDAMSVFRMLRVMEGKRHSYSLDAILKAETDVRKLEIDGVEGDHNLYWHRKMQKEHKFAYCAYNLFDCISIEILDEATKDLSRKIGLYADGSELHTLSSNPKRLANAIYFYLLKQGKVLCSTSDDMTEEFDKYNLDKKGWIVTLANELAEKSGIPIFKELPDLITRIAIAVSDIDITSGYPTAQSVGNVAKSTSLAEVCAIKGLARHIVKQVAVNMMAVPANAPEIGHVVLGLPTLKEWEETLSGIDNPQEVEDLIEQFINRAKAA